MNYFRSTTVFALLILFSVSCSTEPFPVLEKSSSEYYLSTEKLLQLKGYSNKIDSFYNTGTSGFFDGKEEIKILYNYFLQPEKEKGAIVISSGRTEAVIKYKELIYDLYQNGYSIYIHDHRGQGFSGRMLSNSDMGYVEDFQYYIDDMKYFYDNFVLPNNHQNLFLLAHSMGGAIGAIYIEQNPNDFKAASFSSPMLGLPFPTCFVVSVLEGNEPEYAIGNSDYEEGIARFEENDLTHSKIRYQRMLNEFEVNPTARLGGATYQWVNRSCEQFDYIFDNVDNISIPVILFSGSDENIVEPSSHNDFISDLTKKNIGASGYLVNDAKHELLIEKDEVRVAVISKTLEFFEGIVE